ncbi:MAG: PASTA domain-containing protein [Ruminococcaceae bacterium]|nr:PASTA domain-containing protein [Oscillospiraceae bacterium]
MEGKMANETVSTGAIRRSTILAIGVFAVFAILLVRILIIQTVSFEKYQSKVINQMTTESRVAADRGRIYDRNGNVLATNITTYRVFISPSSIESNSGDKDSTDYVNYAGTIAKGLSDILGVEYDYVYKQASYTQYLDRTIQRKVDEKTADTVREFIEDNELEDMVYLEAQSTRYYPGSTLGAHVIGFTSSDGIGLYGLEYQYNEYLKGTDGYYIKARDSYGNEMPYEYASYIEAIDGYNLTTTIDATVQSYLEEQLAKTVSDHNVKNRATGIVMDVNSGAILAMATSAPCDLNDPWALTSDAMQTLKNSGYATDSDEYNKLLATVRTQTWSNKSVGESYIPGSTFKIITSSMALEEKKVSLTETVTCRGSMSVLGIRIHCHKVEGHGGLSFAQGLQQSCNVWFMTLGDRIGINDFKQYANAFGYNEKTGIDLPGEGNGIFNSQMSELDLAIYAFGQNFNVTPIQHISAISSVANGGDLYTPYLVEKITDNSGNVIYAHETEVKRKTVSEDVCKQISTILEEGVSGNGGAKNAYVAGYKVAAKTGTSEKKERECPRCGYTGNPVYEGEGENKKLTGYVCSVCEYKGGEDVFAVSEKYICSTVAYAPADDPQVAIIIIVDEPTKGVLYGSTVAAPYVSDALENILPHLGVTARYTESELAKMAVTVGNYRTWNVSYAKEVIEKMGLEVEIVGGGNTVAAQLPASGSRIEKTGGKVYLYTDKSLIEQNIVVPDFNGMNAITANAVINQMGLNIRIVGASGHINDKNVFVYSQSIAAGTRVGKGEVITLRFRSLDGDEDPSYTEE